MAIAPGQRLGPYEILSPLGAGGMGQVYRAHDSQLNRDVAIKVLPEEFAHDPERLARFRREAQVLASLNHTNIAAIYGLEEAKGDVALALELVDGEDLAERLARGAISLEEALAIARQVAEGLEAAHDKGIIHRDLKPANIRVRPDGTVKVLDFGLAKAGGAGGPGRAGGDELSNSPTMISPAMTMQGVILGTAAYMSPEQARGAAADKRTDLWAFGVVLMEMLTGQQLFSGETVSDVIAAVLRRDIPWSALPEETPAPVRRLLRRCLERDRKKRLADAATARLEIDEALAGELDRGAENAASPATWRRAAVRIVLPTVAATALATSALMSLVPRTGPATPERLMFTIVLPEGMVLGSVGTIGSPPQLSPDGSAVLFKTDIPYGLHVRRLASMDVFKVPGSEQLTNEAFWHDNARITFPAVEGASARLVDVLLPDGAPETVMTGLAPSRGGAWTKEGRVILSAGARLLTGVNGEAVSVPGDPGRLLYPELIPQTTQVVFLRRVDEGSPEVILATMVGGGISEPVVLLRNDTAARYTPSGGGRLLFVRNDNLYAQRLNVTARSLEGEAELVVRDVASQPSLFRADFSVAENGTIAWRPGRAALAQVVTFNRDGKQLGMSGNPAAISSVWLSPTDDARLLLDGEVSSLVNAGDTGRANLPADLLSAFWSPDGRLVGRRRGSPFGYIGASGAVEPIGSVPDDLFISALSLDGQFALGRIGPRALWARVAEMADLKAWTPLSDLDELQADTAFSPDGRFVVYDAAGIYIQPFPGGGRRQLLDRNGEDPVWRADGREIVYLREGAVWSVGITASGDGVTLGQPERLFGGVRRPPGAVQLSRALAVTPDGSRFYVVQGVQQPPSDRIHVLIDRPRR